MQRNHFLYISQAKLYVYGSARWSVQKSRFSGQQYQQHKSMCSVVVQHIQKNQSFWKVLKLLCTLHNLSMYWVLWFLEASSLHYLYKKAQTNYGWLQKRLINIFYFHLSSVLSLINTKCNGKVLKYTFPICLPKICICVWCVLSVNTSW